MNNHFIILPTVYMYFNFVISHVKFMRLYVNFTPDKKIQPTYYPFNKMKLYKNFETEQSHPYNNFTTTFFVKLQLLSLKSST